MSHTPGPWWIEDRRLTHPTSGIKSGGGGVLIQGAPSGPDLSRNVASINPWGGGNMDDARLIAAAPDLLEAATHAEAVMAIVRPRSDTAEYLAAMHKLRAAILKAAGAPP